MSRRNLDDWDEQKVVEPMVSKDEDLKRQVHQLIVKGNLGGTIGELRDDLLKLIRNYGYSERLDELEDITGWSVRGVFTKAGIDYQTHVPINVEVRKAELKAAIEAIK